MAEEAAFNSTAQRVKKIIMEHLDVTEAEVTLDASIKDDLGADSLDVIELTMKLEDEFSRSIPDEDYERLATVGQIVEYIDSATALRQVN